MQASNFDNDGGTRYIILDGTFDELCLEPSLSYAISNGLELTTLSPIQKESLPSLLHGNDAILTAKTGSGKSLAFLIPIIQTLLKKPKLLKQGTLAIVLAPTRELAEQLFLTLEVLTSQTKITIALIRGGCDRLEEEKLLSNGVNVIIATPGRLLDHMHNPKDFCWENLKILVLDEADLLLDLGFEKDILQIVNRLPQERQTVLVSATIEKKTQSLAQSILKKQHVYFSVNDTINNSWTKQLSSCSTSMPATVPSLVQYYHVCRPQTKLHLLFTFLKKFPNDKCIIFFATCLQVAFFYEVLRGLQLSVKSIHSRVDQKKREKNHAKFLNNQAKILLCTDIAARGLHFPNIDWIVQFDPPRDYKQYIHRVGRTARAGSSGKALLFLQPHEKRGFLQELEKAHVNLEELKLSGDVQNIQTILETIVSDDKELHQMAVRALKSYLQSYAYHGLDCFRSKKLDLDSLAKMHGLRHTPHLCKGFKRTNRK